MLIQQVIFYIFAAITVAAALMVIAQNNPVRCVLFLVLAFISSAVLWLLVYAEFLALILILVYVGAVMTLFLFVVMMLNIDVESGRTKLWKKLPVGLVLVAVLTSLLFSAIPTKFMHTSVVETIAFSNQNVDAILSPQDNKANNVSNTEELGLVLYTDYFLAFELAAVILLAAIIAAITLAHRKPIDSKRQDILTQIMTKRGERVKLVDVSE